MLTHAEGENKFNVTVQSKASEPVTVTLVGRWEWSLLLTSHCARLTADLSTHTCTQIFTHTHTSQSHSLTWTTAQSRDDCTSPHVVDCVRLKSFILNTSHYFFCAIYTTQLRRQPAPTLLSPIRHRLNLRASNKDNSIHWGKTLPRSARGRVRMKTALIVAGASAFSAQHTIKAFEKWTVESLNEVTRQGGESPLCSCCCLYLWMQVPSWSICLFICVDKCVFWHRG